MKPHRVAVMVLLLLAFSALSSLAQSSTPDPNSPEAKQARVAWFRDAKYGLFIHWGLYAIPAGQWKGKAAFRYR